MYTEAFLFVGNLLQNGFIEKIKFKKNNFKVRFKNENRYIDYAYTKLDIEYFLEMYEIVEKRK